MIDRKISIRYAKALNKICEDKGINSRDALVYLNGFSQIMQDNREFSEFLKTNVVPMNKRVEIADEILSGSKNFYIKKFVRKDIADKLTAEDKNFYLKEFVKYMIRKNRIDLFKEVIEIFEEIVDEKENKLKAFVTSAVELDAVLKSKLKTNLEKKFNKDIEIKFSIDKKLMAGIVIKIDDIVYDGSINTYLNNLERKLLRLPL